MKQQFSSFIGWVRNWDFMAIIYSLVATFIALGLFKWGGIFRWVRRKRRRLQSCRTYRKTLADECGLLTVVGRRKGFKLNDVFVPLDIAPSDLMPKQPDGSDIEETVPPTYVLVGGPGAGKSTMVKKELLEGLSREQSIPLFVRLRDYQGFDSIEAYLRQRLSLAGFDETHTLLQELFRSGHAFCVLDGLDEVRPQNRAGVVSDINAFYHKYFIPKNRLIVTCRKEAYRDIPLDISHIQEVRPLSDQQIQRFAEKWPLGYPAGKSPQTFERDLAATPRVMELARSPLLLVGGLMQYTESNLGIPEERFEYLARVAKWLVSDWAMAQGHPPDPYRQVYDRLLSRLAYHMHSEQVSEIPRQTAVHLIAEWLPTFGHNPDITDEVIQSIATRTGILVSDDPNTIIFAQFGLQEHFASLEFVDQTVPEKLAVLEPKEWWREVILLAVAQQREPTLILEQLFLTAPLMAAAAVAECPTPSTAMQRKAIEACIASIDKADKAAGSAVVPLLRKVSGQVEVDLCSQLESRLSAAQETASVVGIALATAGSQMATNILARHPEIWDRCLREAGYLSANYENLLVDWIAKGDELQSNRAAELITTRLSMDRLQQLLDLLGTLSNNRAEILSALILEHCGRALHHPSRYPGNVPLTIAARCVPYIRNREQYLSMVVERAIARLREQNYPREIPWRYSISPDLFERLGVVGTCLFLEDSTKQRLSEVDLLTVLGRAGKWSMRQGQFAVWALSALAIALLLLPPFIATLALIATLLSCAIFSCFPYASIPCMPHYFQRSAESNLIVLLLLLAGAGLSSWLLHLGVTAETRLALTLLFVIALHGAAYLIPYSRRMGFIPRKTYHYMDFESPETRESVVFRTSYPGIFMLFLAGAACISWFSDSSANIILPACLGVAGLYGVWLAFMVIVNLGAHRRARRATERLEKHIGNIMESRR